MQEETDGVLYNALNYLNNKKSDFIKKKQIILFCQ